MEYRNDVNSEYKECIKIKNIMGLKYKLGGRK